MADFSSRLRQLRQGRQLSREELAKALKVSYWAIAKYETGDRIPDSPTLQRIADYFEVSVDFLLGRDNKKVGNAGAEFETYDLDEILKRAKVITVDGQPLTEEQKEEVRRYIEYAIKVKRELDKMKAQKPPRN